MPPRLLAATAIKGLFVVFPVEKGLMGAREALSGSNGFANIN